MRMNRKLITLIVVAAMVLAMAPAAFAGTFSDVPSDASYASAVERLAALGFIDGVGGGKYDPESTYTRAQFAALTVKLLGLRSAADAGKGATAFSDVAADHWSSGWVNVATSMGIVRGMGDGTFAPDAPVTHAQALTMIVRALGYEPALKGTWPINVLVKAAELSLTSGVNVIANLPASRGEVAIFANNGLEVPMMIQVGAGDQVKYVVSGTEDTDEKTLLTGSVGKTVEGQVTDTAERVDGKVKVNEITLKPETGNSKTYKVSAGVNVVGLLGKTIEAALRTVSGSDVIVGISDTDDEDFSSKIVKSVTVSGSVYTMELCDSYDAIDNDYDGCDSRQVASDLYLNNKKIADPMDIPGSPSTRAQVKLNDDDKVHVAVVQEWTDADLVSEVNTSKQQINMKVGSREELKDYDVLVVRNGRTAGFGDIAANDVIYVRKDTTRERAVIYAYSNSVSGKFGGANSKSDPKRVTIDSERYFLDPQHVVSTNDGDDYDKDVADVAANATVTAYRDAVGRVFAIRTGTAAAAETVNYALAHRVRQNAQIDPDYAEVSLVLASGSRVEYRANDDTKVNGATQDVEGDNDASDNVANALTTGSGITVTPGNDANQTNTFDELLLVTYKLDDDGRTLIEIKNVTGVLSSDPITSALGDDPVFDDERDRIDDIKVDSGLVVFDAKAWTGSNPSDVKVRTWNAIEKATSPEGDYFVDGRVKVLVLNSYGTLAGAIPRSAIAGVPQWLGGDTYELKVNTKGEDKTYSAKSAKWEVVITGHSTCTSGTPCNMETVADNVYLSKGDVAEVEQAGTTIEVTILKAATPDVGVKKYEVKNHNKSDEGLTLYTTAGETKYYYDADDVVIYDARGTVKKATVDDIGKGDWVKVYTKGATNLIEVIVIVNED